MNDNTSRCRPNFFLLGAAKSGTTSVAKYLDQHPEIFVSKPKEPNYFSFEPNSKPSCKGPVGEDQLYELLLKYSVTSPAEYESLFTASQNESAIGEASVRYLYESPTAARIAEHAPNAKLIVILRDPVDRLYSHYHMNVRQHIEPKDLKSAMEAEDERVEEGWGWDWHYRRVGMYSPQIQRYLDRFDRSQLIVLFHADLQQNPLHAMQQIFDHLEVSSNFQPDFSQRAMVGHTPRWSLLRKIIRDDNVIKTAAKKLAPRRLRKSFVTWTERKNRQGIPPMDPHLRQELHELFTEDRRKLADLLGRELPW